MIDPSYPLQVGIVTALKADTGVHAFFGKGIYDAIPKGAPKPYVALGKPQVLPDKADCTAGAKVYFPIHVWSAGPDSAEVKRGADLVAQALDENLIDIAGHAVVICQLEQTHYVPDPDGITQHAQLDFRYETEPAD